jgi:hypothetical protein
VKSIAGALHLGIFDQPGNNVFSKNSVETDQEDTEGGDQVLRIVLRMEV